MLFNLKYNLKIKCKGFIIKTLIYYMNSNIDLILECPICLSIFDTPRILTECGHTFCSNCIITILNNQDLESIKCPVCNIKSNLDPDLKIRTFKKNYLIQDIINEYNKPNNSTFSKSAPDCIWEKINDVPFDKDEIYNNSDLNNPNYRTIGNSISNSDTEESRCCIKVSRVCGII